MLANINKDINQIVLPTSQRGASNTKLVLTIQNLTAKRNNMILLLPNTMPIRSDFLWIQLWSWICNGITENTNRARDSTTVIPEDNATMSSKNLQGSG
uniref:Putative ovule protein n=1 Tax=Solanum chacoense TaxID=4108 RepID=A0A0V0HVG0_SOLCH